MQPTSVGQRINHILVGTFRTLHRMLSIGREESDAELERRFGTMIEWWKCPPHG
jgi:hypothetical protein